MFREGDTIKMNQYCSRAHAGDILILKYGTDSGFDKNKLFGWKNGISYCNHPNYWELVKESRMTKTNKRKFMNKITAKIKRIFNKSLQTQFKAGLINDCGDLTMRGIEEQAELIRTDYDEKMTARAEEILKEEKEEKEKKE